MSSKVKESFEWYNRAEFANIPKNELLRLTAKTTLPTDHTKDKELPVEERKIRVYPAEELKMAARSLIQRPVLVNHNKEQVTGIVLDAEWAEDTQAVECVIHTSKTMVEDFNKNKFSTCSVRVNAREQVEEEKTITYKGIWFDEVSLVISNLFKAGDPNAKVQAFESKMEFIGVVESVPIEIKVGEPFADYTDWEDCISKNQDKENPEAYCGAIKAQTESKTIEECKEIIAKIPFTLKKVESVPVVPPKEPEVPKIPEKKPEEIIKELQTTVDNAQVVIKELKEKKEAEIKAAKEQVKKEIIEKVDAKLPKIQILNQGYAAVNRLTSDIKKVLKEVKEDE